MSFTRSEYLSTGKSSANGDIGRQFLSSIRQADAIIHVVHLRCFKMIHVDEACFEGGRRYSPRVFLSAVS
jgi:hypothetical protein